jgi:phosphoglycerol transferase MdoB-like AlkP superfamily enzyme
MISIFFIGRVGLSLIYIKQISDVDNFLLTFIYGLRMDTITACVFLVLPAILLAFTPKVFARFIDKILKVYFVSIIAFIIYIENATFAFFAQYDIRPNYLFVEYLEYPKEVFSMIFADYKIELIIVFIMIFGFIYLYLKYIKEDFKGVLESSYIKRILIFIPILLILFIGIRSSFGHRGANNSDAMFSSNRVLNEITKNSIYSIGYAIYSNNKHSNSNGVKDYGKMDISEAMGRFKKRLNIESLNREVKTNFKNKKPKNLVIFLQESIGAQFVEVLGGKKGITPNINALSKEGINFTNLYANGTRSVRGIAGVTSGNFSIPGKGVVKRNKSQHDYFTFSSVLKPYGYRSMFIYGGESRFDNMKGWFLGNGFDEIIDETNFKNPSFKGTWGVSDEDLVLKANERFKQLHKSNQKFATLMFSTSNHTPFEFPDNKIELVSGEKKASVKNAIKYADFAIGRFIELAKKEKYYKDTVFVIVADHNVRVYGNEVVPVNMFQIPGIIIGDGIKAQKYNRVSSQGDVLATALDLLGLDFSYPIMGHSIFSDKKQDLSLMQFHDTYALRVGNKVAVVRPNKQALSFIYKHKRLVETKHDKELEKDALAFVIALDNIYNNKLYK